MTLEVLLLTLAVVLFAGMCASLALAYLDIESRRAEPGRHAEDPVDR